MRTFIVLCLVVVACADEPGYNYQPVGHSDEGLSSQQDGGEAVLSQPIQQNSAPATEYTKEFYSYSAPDEELEDTYVAPPQVSGTDKKNVRVIFIKGPETKGIERAATQLVRSTIEDKTAIYVLHKQPDVGRFTQHLKEETVHIRQKPEVHFVKYRTQEDAQNAQQTIQSQYNSLPGTTHTSNEGVVPVLDFSSASQGHSSAPQAPSSTYVPSNPSPQQSYLPPGLIRFRV